MRKLSLYFIFVIFFVLLFITSGYSASNVQYNNNNYAVVNESDFERELRRIRNPLSDVPGLAFGQELQAIRNRIEHEDRHTKIKQKEEENYTLFNSIVIFFGSLFVGVFISLWSIKKFFMTTKPVLKDYDADEVIDAEFVENDERK